MWSKAKSLLRKAESRDNESLVLAIGDALSRVTQKDAPTGSLDTAKVSFKML